MNTLQYQHIIIQCMHYNNKNILRVVPVTHSKDFEMECNEFYTGVDTSDYITFHNAGKWYDRLLSDLQYKAFKNVKMIKLFKNVWEITFTNKNENDVNNDVNTLLNKKDIYTNWFYNNIQPYIHLKINTYNEDDENDYDLMQIVDAYIDNIKTIEKECKLSKYFDSWVTVEHDYLVLKRPERIDDDRGGEDKYVLSIHEIVALLYTLVYYFLADISKYEYSSIESNLESDEKEPTKEENLHMEICDFTNNIVIDKTRIHKDDLINCLKKQFNVTVVMLMSLRDTESFQSYAKTDDVSPWYSYDKSSKYYWKGSPMSLFEECDMVKYDFVTTDDPVNCLLTTMTHTTPASASSRRTLLSNLNTKDITTKENVPSLLYKNAISNEVKRCSSKVQYLSEFLYIGEINSKTDIGKYIADMIPHISSTNVQDIIQEMSYLMKILSSLHSSDNTKYPDAVCYNDNSDATSLPICTGTMDTQKMYTKDYVDAFKDDSKETVASLVISNIFTYISNFIEPKDINMNKLGQDLVDLGLKKSRKARGFVYGIQLPPQRKVEELIQKRIADICKDPPGESSSVMSTDNSNMKTQVISEKDLKRLQREIRNLTDECKKYNAEAQHTLTKYGISSSSMMN